MYGMTMIVGGACGPAFESALRRALGELGATVLEQTTVPDLPARYAWVWSRGPEPEVPSLAVKQLGRGGLAIDVRTPRFPLWNMALARRLSAYLGVWSAVMVNDRLYDEYGCGFYYAGQVVEAAARRFSEIVTAGGAMSWFHGEFSAVEDENRRHFSARAALVGVEDSCHRVTGGGPIHVFALGARSGGSLHDFDDQMRMNIVDVLPWLRVDAPATTRAVVVDRGDAHVDTVRALAPPGATVETHCLPATYHLLPDGSLDELDSTAVVLHCGAHGSTDALLTALRAIPAAAALVRTGASGIEAWSRHHGGDWTRTVPRDLASLVTAYDPVTRASDERPIRWDFCDG